MKEHPMKIRHLAAWLSVVVLLGASATLIRAQGPGVNPASARAKLRAEIVKLRTEVEMLQFDYDLARVGLMDDVKMEKGLKMAGSMMGAIGGFQVAMNEARNEANAPPSAGPDDALPPGAVAPAAVAAPAVVRPAPSSPPPPSVRPQPSAKDRQQAEAKAKKAQEEAEKKEEAELAKAVADRKKELERIYTSLSAKRLDLEDAERAYREGAR
jgi:hypothetical protein